VDVPGKDGNASMPEHVKRLNPWRKMMMMFRASLLLIIRRYCCVKTAVGIVMCLC
jgi:hypothetical protein